MTNPAQDSSRHLPRKLAFLASLMLALGVALGAFGAHGLEAKLTSKLIKTYQTGVHYLLIHALGLLVVSQMQNQVQLSTLKKVALFFMAHFVFFCFSLMLYAITQLRPLAMVAPIGGLSAILGWLCLCIGLIKNDR